MIGIVKPNAKTFQHWLQIDRCANPLKTDGSCRVACGHAMTDSVWLAHGTAPGRYVGEMATEAAFGGRGPF